MAAGTEKESPETGEYFQRIIDCSPVVVYAKDLSGFYTFINKAFEKLLKRPRGEVIGRTDFDLFPPADAKRFVEGDQRVIASVSPLEEEQTVPAAGGMLVFLTAKYPLLTSGGELCGVSGFSMDITRRRRAEDEIAASLREKEVLLREIHHRVKNNMQVVVSLLRLYALKIDNDQLAKVFEEVRDRINAMALIHESLYQSESLNQVDYGAYLEKLCMNLSEAYGISNQGIALRVAPCHVSLQVDQGIALGMVVCELVSNAFKHAFPKEKPGTVSVSLSRINAKELQLTVHDDGIGLPAEMDIQDLSSLGMQLAVATVTRQLDGKMEVERNGGTRFVVRFPCEGC